MAKQTNKADKKEAKKTLKIKFVNSPTGVYKLAYNVGDVAKLPAALATELIEAKYAELTK